MLSPEIDAYRRRVEGAAEAIRSHLPPLARGAGPWTGAILGTGLGALAKEITDGGQVPYLDIPGFPISTAPGHTGTLHWGYIGERPVLALEGRFHLYEGYSAREVTLPVRFFGRLGVRDLIISNACGGINLDYEKGDLVIIDDHINLMGVNPLIGSNIEEWGPRFPDMAAPYDRARIARLEEIAREEKIRAHRGVYAAVAGPNLETRAEYRMLARLGADVVGMSTVPEAIVAAHEGMRVSAIGIVTDVCNPDHLQPVSVEEILQVAAHAEPKLTKLVRRLLAS
ncbi:MAG: purine-nucleoside phosphorylase [Planctomycetes bacterium]|nr:purine-nucleoside phosphorylase [Planctomycetota bacterium]